MKVINVEHPPKKYWLGRKGEKNFRPVPINAQAWLDQYPNTTVAVICRRPDGTTFPVATSTVGEFEWLPKPDATAVAGEGKLEIHLMRGDEMLGISAMVSTTVAESLTDYDDGEIPETPSWVDEVVQEVTEAASHYPQIRNGTWWVWDALNSEWADTGVSAEGDVSPEEIGQAVEDYMDEHPIEETDPTVPAWAKQPTKPTYTAQEVGALPANTPIPAAVTEQTVAGWGFTKNTGTYSKPASGIPASDLASGVIPSVPQMATQADMSDWTSGKTVDAAVLKTDFQSAVQSLGSLDNAVTSLQARKADKNEIPTAVSELTNDSGFQTAAQVQTAVEGVATFEIPFTTTGLYAPWVFDSSKGVTSADIFDAVYAKRPIVARVETNGEVEIIPANIAQADKDTEYRSAYLEFWTFGDSTANDTEYFFVNMSVEPDIGDPTNEIIVDSNHRVKKTLPAVTASDNGKFLRVVSGAWAAQTVPSAESNSFGGGA